MTVLKRALFSALLCMALVFQAGTAMAQSESSWLSVSDIITHVLVMFDQLLDYWVAGNTLTDTGADLVGAFATIFQQASLFFAELCTLLPSNMA